jgi:hypothetical protein
MIYLLCLLRLAQFEQREDSGEGLEEGLKERNLS